MLVQLVTAFHERPAVILAAMRDARVFPQVLAILAHPQVAGHAILRHAPWIAKSIGPCFGTRAFRFQKGIVGGDAVRLSVRRMLHVYAKQLGQQPREVLAGIPFIAVARAVAAGDIEHPVAPKSQRHAVVSVRVPLDDHMA